MAHLGRDRDRAPVRHRVPRVDDKVHEHLLELPLVGPHHPQVRVVRQREPDLLAHQPVQEVAQVRQRIAQIQKLGLERLLAREGEQLAHEARRTVGVLVDLFEVRVIGMPRIALQQQQIAVPADRGQQVVEVMRDPARKLPDRLHLLALHELRLERLELCRVMQHRHQRRALRVLHPPQRDLEMHLHRGPRGAHDLRPRRPAPRGGVRQPLRDRPPEARHEFREVRRRPALDLQQVPREPVRKQDLPGLRHAQQRHRQRVDQPPARRRARVLAGDEAQFAPRRAFAQFDQPRVHRPACRGDPMHVARGEAAGRSRSARSPSPARR